MKSKVSTSYIPSLDGLRAISVLVVYLSHVVLFGGFSDSNILPGSYGVTVFFFISGFLITRLLMSEMETNGHISLLNFYIRRFLRLYPSLLAFLAAGSFIVFITTNTIPLGEITAGIFYVENYYIAYGAHPSNHFAILWSLAVEEHFYLFYPLLFLVVGRQVRRLLGVVIFLTLIPLICRLHLAFRYGATDLSHHLNYTLSHCRFDSIFYGCISQLLLNSPYRSRYLRLSSYKILYALALVAIPFSLVYPDVFFKQTYRYTVQGLSLMVLVPPIIYNHSYGWVDKILSSRPIVYLGRLSYSIYLAHFLVVLIFINYPFASKWIYALVNFVLSALFTLIGYYAIEVPFFKLRKRFGSHLQRGKKTAERRIKQITVWLYTEPAEHLSYLEIYFTGEGKNTYREIRGTKSQIVHQLGLDDAKSFIDSVDDLIGKKVRLSKAKSTEWITHMEFVN